MVDEHLGLVFEPPEGVGVNDPVTIALVLGSAGSWRLSMTTAGGCGRSCGIGGQAPHRHLRPGQQFKQTPDCVVRYRLDAGFTEALQQHIANGATLRLLVHTHELEVARRTQIGSL